MEKLQREKRQKELQIKAIHLKAIPHFHANVLASIEYYLMNNSNEEASHYLKMYSDFTNKTLSDIDRPARTIDEELEYIRLYLGLEQLRLGERLKYSFVVDDGVDRKTLLPTMLFYTYCQNAVKHGIGNKPEGGHIDIRIHQNDRDVVVEVIDDGVGRTAAAHLNRSSTKQGLLLLNEQIDLYNQTNSRPIRHKVTDLYDTDGNPSGTNFEMSVPLYYQFEEKNITNSYEDIESHRRGR
jgi:sensor histidine kinase YesM